jgi:hypothetical protein
MSIDKQIEEMAKVIQNTYLPINQGNVTVGETRLYSRDAHRLAENLYNAGYRKVDSVTFMGGIVEQMRADVAEEIFAEIDKLLAVDRHGEANLDVRAMQRLKEKYTKEITEEGK